MFTDSSSPPTIIDSSIPQNDVLTIFTGTLTVWRRTITTTQFRRTWMEKATADSMAATYNAMTDSTATYTAAVNRMSDNGAFQVNVTSVTKSSYVQDT